MNAPHVDCWHFAAATLRDGRPLPVKGQTLVHDGPVVLCKSGFHGSVRALDALYYGPGSNVARVRLSGERLTDVDKYCARVRTNITDYVDASRVLHEFACWRADRAMDAEVAAGRAVDPRSREAVRVKRAWLDGLATDEELDAAKADAWDAAGYTAGFTAWSAALAAAMDAARAAAWDAAWDTARAAQESKISRALYALLGVQP